MSGHFHETCHLFSEQLTNSTLIMDPKKQAALISIDILKFIMESEVASNHFAWNEHRDCLGKRLCKMSQESKPKVHQQKISALESAMLKIAR